MMLKSHVNYPIDHGPIIDRVSCLTSRNPVTCLDHSLHRIIECRRVEGCLLYTSDAADEEDSVDLCGGRIIKKKKKKLIRDILCIRMSDDNISHKIREQHRLQ
eukprot:TRINITY_DN58383_c0_g1_i1.p1 TRINITY_DN58383_c0_g1~~TRINITY_DN58383_c0_g1_i1.p1  ORF type:complete len:103 (-),score=11.21 TRINITY_DN58383_c0_g1_i1:2-310(-)